MTRLLKSLLFAAGLLVGISLVWRYASRRYTLPCPSWLGVLLENRLVDRVAGSAALLDRAGVKSGMRVLDAGCGPGRLSLPAAERVGPMGEVIAVDIQPAMLRRLEARLNERGMKNVRTVLGNLGQTPLESDSFDRAFLVTVLGEIPDRLAALRSIHAALKPGGILSITEVLPDPHYQTRSVVRRLGEAAGFTVETVQGSARAFTMNLRKG